jgi:hypothetical protein
VQETKEAAARLREREVVQGLENLGDVHVYKNIMSLRAPIPFPRKIRFVRHRSVEGGPNIELLTYIAPANLEEKVTTRVILCIIQKGMKCMAKRVKEAINGKGNTDV